jgi:Kazal-type serine protease inhibitor domain
MTRMTRLVTRFCLAALVALGIGMAAPVQDAAAQGFSIEIGPGGVQLGANCPRAYDPVCAGSRSNPRTYRNACLAQRDGARIRYEGECERRGGGEDFGDRGPACPRNYAPVCAQNWGGAQQTFSNSCLAEVARARVLYRGECRRGGTLFDDGRPPVDRACPRIFAPVCAGPRGRERTYSNSCLAERAGARVRYSGECRF